MTVRSKLVDTSIWIDFFHGSQAAAGLGELLREGAVLLHPWVLGEVALGNLGAKRSVVLRDLAALPAAPVVTDEELLAFVEHHGLAASGVGWVDVQIMASARLASAGIWTGDQRLLRAWGRVQAGSA